MEVGKKSISGVDIRSSVEHFARVVSSRQWKDVFIQMLTACFDGAGKDSPKHNILTVAGFASFASIWDEFTGLWNSRLAQDGLEYFHIRIDDYKGVLKGHAEQRVASWPLLDAFGVCAMNSVEAFLAYASGEGITRNVRYVFEKGDPEDVLRFIMRGKGLPDPDFTWSKPHTDAKGFTHDPFVGLQAAGWIAYEYYLDSDRLIYGTPSD